MQKDMKIGMLAGVVLVAGAMFYVCTRSDFSTESRIRNREIKNGNLDDQAVQNQIDNMVRFGPATASAKTPEPVRKEIPPKQETRFVRELPSFDTATQQEVPKTVDPEPVVVEKPKRIIERPPVRTYKPKKFYIVRRGDSLSKISKMYYGSANEWYVIYDANRDKISNPNKIKEGMKLYIPD
jgi:nucleoid-associated protein YgaU